MTTVGIYICLITNTHVQSVGTHIQHAGEGRGRIGTNRNKNLSTGLQHEGMESNVSLSLQRISQTTEQTEKNMEMINQLLSTPLTNTAHVSMTDLHSHVHSLTRRMFREYE